MNVIQLNHGSLLDMVDYFASRGKILARGEVFIQQATDVEDLSSGEASRTAYYYVDSTGKLTSGTSNGKIYDQNGIQIKKIYEGELFGGTGRSDQYVRLGAADALKFGGLVTEANSIATAVDNPYRLYYIVNSEDAKNDIKSASIKIDEAEMYVDGIPTQEDDDYSAGGHLYDFIFADEMGNYYYIRNFSATGDRTYINATGNGLVDETYGTGMTGSLADSGKTVSDFEKDKNVTETTLQSLINTVLPKYCHYEGTASSIIDNTAPSTAKGAAYYVDVDSGTTQTTTTSSTETTVNKTQTLYYVDQATTAATADDGVTQTIKRIFQSTNVTSKYTAELYEGDIIYFEEDNTANVIPLGHLINTLSHVDVERGDSYAIERWATEDADLNNTSKNLIKAIQLLYTSKADLDPVTRKVITSEIPDWLLAAPKYQATIAEDVFGYEFTEDNANADADTTETFATPKKSDWSATDYIVYVFNNLGFEVSAEQGTNGGFTITTTTDVDKNDDDNSETDDVSTDTSIVSGMYWIYNGNPISLTETRDNEDESVANNIISEIFSLTTGDDGELQPGDWVIWNSTVGKFEKLDHSDNLSAIYVKLTDGGKIHALTYMPTFETEIRGVVNGKGYLGTTDTTNISEVELESNDQRFAQIGTDYAVLSIEELDNHGIIIGNSNKTVVESEEIIANTTAGFDITRSDGIVSNLHPGETSTSIEAHNKEAFTPYKFDHDLLRNLGLTVVDSTGAPVSKWYDTGFDLSYAINGDTSNIINASYVTEDHTTTLLPGYGYDSSISTLTTGALKLPTSVTGTLTTMEYVNEHIELVEKLIGALYDNVVNGTEHYVQLIWIDDNNVKHIGDSYIATVITSQELNKLWQNSSNKLDGSRTLTIFNDLTFDSTTHSPTHNDEYFNHNIITAQNLDDANIGAPKNTEFAPLLRYGSNELRSAVPSPDFYGNTVSNQINPTNKKQINNYLPNHSGVLLNDFSVIDCGYWSKNNINSSSESAAAASMAESIDIENA